MEGELRETHEKDTELRDVRESLRCANTAREALSDDIAALKKKRDEEAREKDRELRNVRDSLRGANKAREALSDEVSALKKKSDEEANALKHAQQECDDAVLQLKSRDADICRLEGELREAREKDTERRETLVATNKALSDEVESWKKKFAGEIQRLDKYMTKYKKERDHAREKFAGLINGQVRLARSGKEHYIEGYTRSFGENWQKFVCSSKEAADNHEQAKLFQHQISNEYFSDTSVDTDDDDCESRSTANDERASDMRKNHRFSFDGSRNFTKTGSSSDTTKSRKRCNNMDDSVKDYNKSTHSKVHLASLDQIDPLC